MDEEFKKTNIAVTRLEKMMRLFANVITILFLSLSSAFAEPKSITVEGSTPVTGELSENTLKSRALVDALRKVFFNISPVLDSFTLIENGVVRLDQIEAKAKIKLLNLEILSSVYKAKHYSLKVLILYTDVSGEPDDSQCNSVSAGQIPTEVRIFQEHGTQPFWLFFDESEFKKVLPISYQKNNLVPKPTKNSAAEVDDYYTLTKRRTNNKDLPSYFGTEVIIRIETMQTRSLIKKGLHLKLLLTAKTKRQNDIIAISTEHIDVGSNAMMLEFDQSSITRANFTEVKKYLESKFGQFLKKHVQKLNCVSFSPRVNLKSGVYNIDYGYADGFKKGDIFVSNNHKLVKAFYIIDDIEEYSAKLKAISQEPSQQLTPGDTLQLIRGSS